VGLDQLPEQLAAADIVLTSTASPHAIVGFEELELVMSERKARPLLLIDIAVPRDIEPACAGIAGVTLRDIDDLQALVARNLSSRATDVPRAEAIIAEEIDRFAGWLGQLDVRPTIAELRARGDQVVERVLADNAGHWESASAADLERIDALARAITTRLLHEPTLRLKALEPGHGHGAVELLRELFALPRSEAEASADDAEVRQLRRDRSA
jgi:glutamyl-tRNA reductase